MHGTPKFHAEPVDLGRQTDWDDLFATYWESWKDPLQVTGMLTFPWLGEDSPREKASYHAAKEAYLEQARQNPDQCWLKIEDRSVTGRTSIVGGGAFTIVREGAPKPNPSANNGDSGLPEIKLPGLGYPANSERDILMRQFYLQMRSWHPRIMTDRPHLYGQALWVLPAFRHLGAAAVVMDYFTEKADALSVECFLEGSAIGTPLYLQKGFVLLERPVMVFRYFARSDKEKIPSEEWIRLVRGLHAEPIAIMWRPVRGDYDEGKTVLPWVGRPREARL
ncbi:hypothetical protein GGS23DRAFT_568038 [Durotheca rogersii]|uniref:uncharacterized protein n=1 Tax=Durotheca rogersii TaxID=419775 RepID=UPI00221F8F1A|nr:uncharacterized protein GGS23DRAFT_568038 [Durotheca rogersii]KAI5863059.1 hypothetical protein GGS23DRAFT_568038 [Durotheca rogersii]